MPPSPPGAAAGLPSPVLPSRGIAAEFCISISPGQPFLRGVVGAGGAAPCPGAGAASPPRSQPLPGAALGCQRSLHTSGTGCPLPIPGPAFWFCFCFGFYSERRFLPRAALPAVPRPMQRVPQPQAGLTGLRLWPLATVEPGPESYRKNPVLLCMYLFFLIGN